MTLPSLWPESVTEVAEIFVNNMTRDVLIWLNTVLLGDEGEVAKFVGADHVVGFQSRVKSLVCPSAADRHGIIQDEDFGLLVCFAIRLGHCQTVPPCEMC